MYQRAHWWFLLAFAVVLERLWPDDLRDKRASRWDGRDQPSSTKVTFKVTR